MYNAKLYLDIGIEFFQHFTGYVINMIMFRAKWTIFAILFVFTLNAWADGDIEAGERKATACIACHNKDGNSAFPEWPKIAGQYASYSNKQIHNFKIGKASGRANATMAGIVASLTDEDIADLGAYFASQVMSTGYAKADLVEKGQALYRGGDMERGIPACMACHGAQGLGIGSAKFPHLAGQHATYVEIQLKAFRSHERHNDLNGMMQNAAAKLTDEDIAAVASYIEGLY